MASVALQVGAQLALVIGMQLYTVVVNRFAMLYAPPHLFGTFGICMLTLEARGHLYAIEGFVWVT